MNKAKTAKSGSVARAGAGTSARRKEGSSPGGEEKRSGRDPTTCRRCLRGVALVLVVLAGAGLFNYVWHRMREPSFQAQHVLGAVTDRSARVWIYAAHHSHVSIQHRPTAHDHTPTQADWSETDQYQVENGKDAHWTLVVDLVDLAPNTSYEYRVVFFKSNSDEPSSVSDVHRFRTYPSTGTATRFSFIYGSCIELGFPWPFDTLEILSTWKRLYDPLLTVILGDIIYADLPFPIPFERAYRKLLDDDHYSRFFKEVPRYAIYDDHELANNWDQGMDLPLYKDAMEAYDAFIGSANPDLILGRPNYQIAVDERKRYYNFTVGNVGFFVMDERQYRSANYDEDGPNKTMLGLEQKEYFKQWLIDTNDTLTFRFIVSPGMFASVGGPADGWYYFEHEREELFDFMENHAMSGIFLLSGDVHWAAAFEHRDGLYEFATSPIHTFPLLPDVRPSRIGRDVRTIFTHTWTCHFSVVEVDTTADRPFMQHTTYAYLLDSTQPWPVHTIKLYLEDVRMSPQQASTSKPDRETKCNDVCTLE